MILSYQTPLKVATSIHIHGQGRDLLGQGEGIRGNPVARRERPDGPGRGWAASAAQAPAAASCRSGSVIEYPMFGSFLSRPWTAMADRCRCLWTQEGFARLAMVIDLSPGPCRVFRSSCGSGRARPSQGAILVPQQALRVCDKDLAKVTAGPGP